MTPGGRDYGRTQKSVRADYTQTKRAPSRNSLGTAGQVNACCRYFRREGMARGFGLAATLGFFAGFARADFASAFGTTGGFGAVAS